MTLFIKNMVSPSCKAIIKIELEKLGLFCLSIELGRIEAIKGLSDNELRLFRIAILEYGFDLIDNKKEILIEKVKIAIIEFIYSNERIKVNFSDYLSAKLNLDYTYMANIFSEDQHITIEHLIIFHRIERVKELIRYNELSLTEISWKMHYSSVAHLSTQFKKVTCETPSHFKQQSLKSYLSV